MRDYILSYLLDHNTIFFKYTRIHLSLSLSVTLMKFISFQVWKMHQRYVCVIRISILHLKNKVRDNAMLAIKNAAFDKRNVL